MNAILQKTKEGDKVWRAASTLLNASNSTNSISSRMDLSSGQTDNWKDLIANIEMEDDIICLYRKNSNETTKRADDWKKFLETVTPGHEVHLAIDTGRKYVICLKKKQVPETTSQATSTTTKKASTTINISSTVPTRTTNAISTVDQPTSMSSVGSRALKKFPPEPSSQKPEGIKDHLCRGKQDDVPLDDASNLKNAAKNRREKTEIRRQMGNYLSASSPTRVDCCCKKPGLHKCDNVPDEFPFSLPIIFVVLNPNDYPGYKSLSTMNLPFYQEPRLRQRWPCQTRRCMTKPLALAEYNSPNPSTPTSPASERLRDPFFDYNSAPLQSIGGLFPQKILDEKARNDDIARRTLLRSKRPSPALDTKRTSCLTDPTRLFIQKKEALGKSMPDTSYVDYMRSVAERNRYENSRINHHATAGQAFPPIHKIYTSPITTRPYRQPIVVGSRSWDYNKLPYSRKVYSPIQNSQTKPHRPALMRYINRKDPNVLASRPPCQNSHCTRIYQKPLINYNPPPRPFQVDKFQFGNPAIRLPLLYSLLLSENLGLNGFPDISNKLKCPKPCDKPIKLQVIINGKVHEPLDVAVLSEPGQKVDLVGFSYPMLPHHQPGIPINYLPLPTRLPADTHTYSETEISTRMDLEKLNTREASLTESGFSADNNFETAETNSTTQVAIETTTFASDIVSVAGTDIEQQATQETTSYPTTVIRIDEPMTATTTPSPTTTIQSPTSTTV